MQQPEWRLFTVLVLSGLVILLAMLGILHGGQGGRAGHNQADLQRDFQSVKNSAHIQREESLDFQIDKNSGDLQNQQNYLDFQRDDNHDHAALQSDDNHADLQNKDNNADLPIDDKLVALQTNDNHADLQSDNKYEDLENKDNHADLQSEINKMHKYIHSLKLTKRKVDDLSGNKTFDKFLRRGARLKQKLLDVIFYEEDKEPKPKRNETINSESKTIIYNRINKSGSTSLLGRNF